MTSYKKIGLNAVKAYTSFWDEDAPGGAGVADDTRFGTGGEAIQDAGALGATVIRQFGRIDLEWSLIAPPDAYTSEADLWSGKPVPLADELEDLLINDAQNIENLVEMLRVAHGAGVRVLFTLLSLGGGDMITDPVPTVYVTDTEYEAEDGSVLAAEPGTLKIEWSDDHEGMYTESFEDLAFFPLTSRRPLGYSVKKYATESEWHLATFDVCSSYKRALMMNIAGVVGQLLVKVNEALAVGGYGFDLTDVVEGIEIFNEIEQESIFKQGADYSAEGSAIAWGTTCFDLAYALREGLGEGLDDIKIRLPGVTSYYEDAAAKDFETWEARKTFLRGLVFHFVRRAVEVYRTPEDVALNIPRLLQGTDYHWYHKGDAADARAGIKHIGFLVHEVEELRQAVSDGAEHALDPLVFADVEEHFATFPISVLENGTSVTSGANPFGGDREDFQAWDIWRRLGGALASVADMAGWHAWMSLPDGPFVGTGLRYTATESGTPAGRSRPLRGWLAYQRLAELLGQVQVGRMVLAETGSRAELVEQLTVFKDQIAAGAIPERDLSLVVLEFVGNFSLAESEVGGPPTVPFAYLVFRDPSLVSHVTAMGSNRQQVWADRDTAAGGWGEMVQMGIKALSQTDEPTWATLPGATASYDTPEWVQLPLALDPDPEDHPMLFFSEVPLQWALGSMPDGVAVVSKAKVDSLPGPDIKVPGGY